MTVQLLTPREIERDGQTFSFPRGLPPFQVEAVRYARGKKRTFIVYPVGTGKTTMALAVAYLDQAFPLLIVCPSKSKIQLTKEVLALLPGRTVGYIGKVPLSLRGKVLENGYSCDVVVINDELLSHGDYKKGKTKAGKIIHGNTYSEEFVRCHFRAIIVDESHRFANAKSARSLALRLAHIQQIPIRLFLTATPVNPKPMKYVNQLYLLGRLEDLGGWMYFVKRYCDAEFNPYLGVWKYDGHSNLDELVARLKTTCYVRRRKREILPELPPVVRVPFQVELESMSKYNMVSFGLTGWIRQLSDDRKLWPIKDAAQRIDQLRELTGLGKVPHVKEWVENFLEETEDENEKLIVFAYHRSVQRALLDTFPGVARIHADDKFEVREAYKDRFNTDPSCRLMVASLTAGGESLNISGATYMLFVELPWTPDALDQAEGRAHGRLDNLHGLTSYFMLAEDTIDIEMADLLDAKMQVMAHATDGAAANQEEMVAALINKLRVTGRRKAA